MLDNNLFKVRLTRPLCMLALISPIFWSTRACHLSAVRQIHNVRLPHYVIHSTVVPLLECKSESDLLVVACGGKALGDSLVLVGADRGHAAVALLNVDVVPAHAQLRAARAARQHPVV